MSTTPQRRQPPVDYIPRITAQYSGLGYGEYRWLESEEAPNWVPLSKPLSNPNWVSFARVVFTRAGRQPSISKMTPLIGRSPLTPTSQNSEQPISRTTSPTRDKTSTSFSRSNNFAR